MTGKETSQTQQLLQKSETRYRELFTHMTSGVAIYSASDDGADFVFVDINEAGLTIGSLKREDVIGKMVTEVIPNIRDMGLLEVFQRVWKKGVAETFPAVEYTDNRQSRWYENHVYKLPSGEIVSVYDDITARKQTEERLQRSEQKYRSLVENIHEIIFSVNLDGGITYVSSSVADILGYSPEEVSERPYTEFVDPEDLTAIHEAWGDVVAGNPLSREFRMIAKSGVTRWVLISGNVILENGIPTGVQGVMTDVTERKQAEMELRQTKNRLQLAVLASQIGIWDWNLSTNQVFFDSRYYTMAGYEVDEFPHQLEEFTSRVHPEDVERVMKEAKRHLEGQIDRFALEFRFRMKSGDWMWVQANGSIVERDNQGRPLRFMGTHLDITKRKQAEINLKRLATAIDQAAETVVITDAQGLIQYVNPAFEAVTGYTRDQVLGQNPSVLKSGWQDPAFYQELWETLTSGKTWKGRFVNKRKNGSLYTEDAVISPVHDAEGHIINYVGVKRDLTEQLRLSEQLQQPQKMDAIGRLAGGVAHDFNNMLTVILGHAELALDTMESGQPLFTELQEIQKAARRSADLTRQLLAFARKQVVKPKVIELNEAVDGMLKMLGRLIGEDIELSWLPGKNLWPIQMDPGQLDQILANLCVNARDAISGSGKITLETGTTVFDEVYGVEAVGIQPGEYVWLAVSDNGCGMNKKTQEKVFEPFFSTKGAGEGTGLGLATVYGAVMQNKGYIHLYSEPGHGTTFHVYLPRHVGKGAPAQPSVAVEPAIGGHETVLLVEDDPSILKISRYMLERLGYQVLATSIPGEAIKLAEEHAGEIHLLMTDVVMPEMNGRDLAQHLMGLHPSLKLLFMSGYTADVIAHHGVLEDGVQFIAKPFSMQDLSVKLREALTS